MTAPLKRASALICCPVLVAVLAGCAATATTSAFKGAQHEVAQVVANLQSEATAGEEKKICTNVLASGVVARLNKSPGGCEAAIKGQLGEIDSFELTVQAVQVSAAGTSASARVKSIYAGKSAIAGMTLVKETGKWKVSGLQ